MPRRRRPVAPLRLRLRYARIWTGALLRYTGWRAWARVTGTHTLERRSAVARRLLEGIGPVGVLVGRLLAMRVELIRLTMSLELSRLQVDAPPFDVAVALEAIAWVTGGPVEATFAALDPTPVESGPLSCVWLGELNDGRRVTVRVRRPGIREELAAAFAVLGRVARAFESVAALLPGLFDALEQDLDDVLLYGTDLVWTSRLQMLLAQRIERDGPEGVVASKVFVAWLAEDIAITEELGGVPLTEVIRAVEDADQPALERFARRGIRPERVARRLLELSWWQAFEAPIYEAEPSARRLAVRNGGTIVVHRRARRGGLHHRAAAAPSARARGPGPPGGGRRVGGGRRARARARAAAACGRARAAPGAGDPAVQRAAPVQEPGCTLAVADVGGGVDRAP
jgi:ubiquinone biosynthesis protein